MSPPQNTAGHSLLTNGKISWLPYSTLILLFLLHLVPYLFPGARMWGFNHLIFLSPIYTLLYIVLGLAALTVPFLTFSRTWGERLAEGLQRTFFESRRKYVNRGIFIVFCGAVFALFPMKTHFLGDGYQLLSNLASSSGTFVKWSEQGITLILLGIQSLLGPQNETTALTAFQIVSVASGIITVWFYFLIAESASDSPLLRLLVFLVSLLSGSLLLFFGYVENYPVLWIALTGFVYFGFRHLRTGEGLIYAGLFLIFAIFIHLLMAMFIPAFIYLFFSRGARLTIYRRFTVLLWGLAGLAVVAGILIFIRKYTTDIYFENIFLPPFNGKPINPSYALFSFPHLVDIIDHLLLLSPFLPLFIVLSYGNLKETLREKSGVFLALAAAGGLIFLLVIDPTLGLGRDWDLFSVTVLGTSLLFALAVGRRGRDRLRIFFVPLSVILALSVVPYMTVNLHAESSLKYVRSLIEFDDKKSMGALLAMYKYYLERKDSANVDSMLAEFGPLYELEYKYERALQILDLGDIELGRTLVSQLPPDRFSSRYHNLISIVAYSDHDYAKAMAESDTAIQLQRYGAALYHRRALILASMGNYKGALDVIRIGYRLNSGQPIIIDFLMRAHYHNGTPDSSIYYARKMLQFDSRNPIPYYYLALSNSKLNRTAEVKSNAEMYLRYCQKDPIVEERKREIDSLLRSIQ